MQQPSSGQGWPQQGQSPYGQPSSQPLPQPKWQEQPESQSQPYYQPMPPSQPLSPPYQQAQPVPPQYQQPQPQMMPPQMQQPQPMYQQPVYMPQPQPVMVNNVVQVNVQQKGPGFLVRALYFIFIGYWFGFFWLNLGFFLCALIITLPLGLMMLNRLPQVMTLKPAGTSTNVNVTTVANAGGVTNVVQVNVGGTQQVNMLIRAIYFLFVGWWAGYIWACIGYLLCCLIVTIPVGVMVFDRLPAVLTLRRN